MANAVEIGKTVVVDLNGKRLLPMTIAGVNEGAPDFGTVSCDAPLVKAILGKGEGEVATFRVDSRMASVKVVRVLS